MVWKRNAKRDREREQKKEKYNELRKRDRKTNKTNGERERDSKLDWSANSLWKILQPISLLHKTHNECID
jgi:hypothetical protein